MTVDTNAPERIWAGVDVAFGKKWFPHSNHGGTPYIRLDLHEAAVRKARKVKVRALVWGYRDGATAADDYRIYLGGTFGTNDHFDPRYKVMRGAIIVANGPKTLEAAKAAAAADYERRILEALSE